MEDINRLARDLKEKYEDRGWGTIEEEIAKEREKKMKPSEIIPLPISEEQYRACAAMLAKEAISNNDAKSCQEYFELKRRAIYGNKYSEIDGMEDIERQMWKIGTGEKATSSEKHIR